MNIYSIPPIIDRMSIYTSTTKNYLSLNLYPGINI